jgi:uncharacterized low-complexity protein
MKDSITEVELIVYTAEVRCGNCKCGFGISKKTEKLLVEFSR